MNSAHDFLTDLAPSATGHEPMGFRERIKSFTFEDWRAAMVGEDPVATRKGSPEIALRRAKNVKVVKFVVAVCAALCLLALVRLAIAAPETGSADESEVGQVTSMHTTKAAPLMKHDAVTHETAHSGDARASEVRARPRRR
jgi:hypothetical protein